MKRHKATIGKKERERKTISSVLSQVDASRAVPATAFEDGSCNNKPAAVMRNERQTDRQAEKRREEMRREVYLYACVALFALWLVRQSCRLQYVKLNFFFLRV
jgi:hypothetical protein